MPTCSCCNDFKKTECPDCKGTGQMIQLKEVGFWTWKCTKCNESGEITCPDCAELADIIKSSCIKVGQRISSGRQTHYGGHF
jgi:DnaJ-class molecular chaperone